MYYNSTIYNTSNKKFRRDDEQEEFEFKIQKLNLENTLIYTLILRYKFLYKMYDVYIKCN